MTNSAAPDISFEFSPPRTPQMEETLWGCIRRLESLAPTFVSVTYGAGGSTRERTHNTVKRIVDETTLKPAAHLTCVAATCAEIDGIVKGYWDAGVAHIVALRGDPPGGLGQRYEPHPGGYASSPDLVAGIKRIGDFEISVSCYPEGHPDGGSLTADLDLLKRKIDAGATRAITQFFFDAPVFLRFLEKARAAGITVPIVPGIMPISNFKSVRNFAQKAGASVPAWLGELFEDLDDDPDTRQLVAATCAAELCLSLRKEGIHDFHFYTMNRPELTFATCHMLGIRPLNKRPKEAVR